MSGTVSGELKQNNLPKELAVEVWDKIRCEMNERDQNRFLDMLSEFIMDDRKSKIDECDGRLKYLVLSLDELRSIINTGPPEKVMAKPGM